MDFDGFVSMKNREFVAMLVFYQRVIINTHTHYNWVVNTSYLTETTRRSFPLLTCQDVQKTRSEEMFDNIKQEARQHSVPHTMQIISQRSRCESGSNCLDKGSKVAPSGGKTANKKVHQSNFQSLPIFPFYYPLLSLAMFPKNFYNPNFGPRYELRDIQRDYVYDKHAGGRCWHRKDGALLAHHPMAPLEASKAAEGVSGIPPGRFRLVNEKYIRDGIVTYHHYYTVDIDNYETMRKIS